MDEEKKHRLKEHGWIETTVQDFLELTPEEAAYIELKLLLSRNLRERREKLNMSQVVLAKKIESSQSRISKMEAGDPSVSIDLLIRSLLSLGVTPAELGNIITVNA